MLDLACGTGKAALFLAKTFRARVLGLDYSSRNIALARQGAQEEGLQALVEFREGDAEHLPLGDGTFDALICECAFCLFPEKAKAAKEIFRVLKPGGGSG